MTIDPLEARPSAVPEAVLARLRAAVGPRGYTEDPDEIAPLCLSWRDNWRGWVPMVVRPATTAEVAEVVRICAETHTPIVPQGGNTGMTGASQPHGEGREIILSTSRMRQVRGLDLANDTVTGAVPENFAEEFDKNLERRGTLAWELMSAARAAE